jgi:hypothetical protein
MKPYTSTRLRTPALLAGVTVVTLAIGGATRGWASVGDVA